MLTADESGIRLETECLLKTIQVAFTIGGERRASGSVLMPHRHLRLRRNGPKVGQVPTPGASQTNDEDSHTPFYPLVA